MLTSREKLLVAVLTGAMGASLAGCSSSVDEAEETSATVDQPSVQPPRVQPPRVETLKEPRNAEQAVLRLRRLISDQAFPLVLELYDPRVRRAISEGEMLGALVAVAPTLGIARTTRIRKERVRAGVLLTLDYLVPGEPTRANSYLVQRRRGEWIVVYDSLLGEALGSYAKLRVQENIDAAAETPSRRAVAAGASATLKYQQAAFAVISDSPSRARTSRRP